MTVALTAFDCADLFAGAGGASEGVRLGRDPAVAVNHSPEAISAATTAAAGTPVSIGSASEPVIADIGMRMLSPRELFRAQGFPDSYVIDLDYDGAPLTKTAQVRLAGNSVPPQLVEAIVRANLGAAREEMVA